MKAFKNYDSRKLQISLLLLAIATVALFTGTASFEAWSTFINILFGTYFTANVVEKFTTPTQGISDDAKKEDAK